MMFFFLNLGRNLQGGSRRRRQSCAGQGLALEHTPLETGPNRCKCISHVRPAMCGCIAAVPQTISGYRNIRCHPGRLLCMLSSLELLDCCKCIADDVCHWCQHTPREHNSNTNLQMAHTQHSTVTTRPQASPTCSTRSSPYCADPCRAAEHCIQDQHPCMGHAMQRYR